MDEKSIRALVNAADACPYQTWAAFTDDSGSRPHTNLVSFTGPTECVLALPGLHKSDPLVAYLWAAQPGKVRQLADERAALLEALVGLVEWVEELERNGKHPTYDSPGFAEGVIAKVTGLGRAE